MDVAHIRRGARRMESLSSLYCLYLCEEKIHSRET